MLATPPQQAQVQAYLAAETQQSCVVLQHLKQQQVHEQQHEAETADASIVYVSAPAFCWNPKSAMLLVAGPAAKAVVCVGKTIRHVTPQDKDDTWLMHSYNKALWCGSA